MNLYTFNLQKLIAEAVGAFALVFIGVGSILLGGSLLVVAVAHGLVIAVMVSILGHVSGAIFNPALTLGFWVTRRLSHLDTITYIIAQVLGGIVGALALVMLYPDALREGSGLGTPVLASDVSFAQGVGIEVILTAFLMLSVFGTALDSRGPFVGGFAIGMVITMAILAAGPLTGAAMNPARALGPALIDGTWDGHLVFWIGPIIGAVLAALLYHFVFLDEEQRATSAIDAPEAVEAS